MNLRFCLLFMASLWLGRCWEAPWFCHDYDCPVYTLVKAYESFEERSYAASRWITTDIESTSESDVQDGILKLYEFMQGENEEGKKMTMTRPVLVSVKNQGHVSISLFISADVVLPQPNDKTIKNKNMPAATVYVREFGGFASETSASENMETLKKDLQAAGKSFDDTRFEAVGYDGPLVLIDRHNEIWIYAD